MEYIGGSGLPTAHPAGVACVETTVVLAPPPLGPRHCRGWAAVISPAYRTLTRRMTSHPQGRLCILPRCLSKPFLPDVKDIAGQCPLLSPMGSDFMLTTFSTVPDEGGCFLWESACSHPFCVPSPSVRQECGPHGRRSLSRKAIIATHGVQNTGEDNFTFVLGNFKQQIESHQKGI